MQYARTLNYLSNMAEFEFYFELGEAEFLNSSLPDIRTLAVTYPHFILATTSHIIPINRCQSHSFRDASGRTRRSYDKECLLVAMVAIKTVNGHC